MHDVCVQWMCGVGCLLPLCCDETLTKNNLGKERMFGLQVSVHHQGKLGQELEAGTGTGLVLISFCSLLMQCRLTCLGIVPPTVDWSLFHQLVIKKMPPRHAHRPITWRQFLSWGVLNWQRKLTWLRVPGKHFPHWAITLLPFLFWDRISHCILVWPQTHDAILTSASQLCEPCLTPFMC